MHFLLHGACSSLMCLVSMHSARHHLLSFGFRKLSNVSVYFPLNTNTSRVISKVLQSRHKDLLCTSSCSLHHSNTTRLTFVHLQLSIFANTASPSRFPFYLLDSTLFSSSSGYFTSSSIQPLSLRLAEPNMRMRSSGHKSVCTKRGNTGQCFI